MNVVCDFVKTVFSYVAGRIVGSPKVKVQSARAVGEKEKPGLAVTVAEENPQGQNAFVDAFDVIMITPFQDSAVRYEFCVAGVEANIERLPINIPGHGISKALTVIAHFNNDMSSSDKHYKAKIAATGRAGFIKRYTEFGGDCTW